jgi:hypothetical protein
VTPGIVGDGRCFRTVFGNFPEKIKSKIQREELFQFDPSRSRALVARSESQGVRFPMLSPPCRPAAVRRPMALWVLMWHAKFPETPFHNQNPPSAMDSATKHDGNSSDCRRLDSTRSSLSAHAVAAFRALHGTSVE